MTISLATGTLLGRYKILHRLGAGGMGVVYKALDTTLDRPVALKLLPADLVEREDRVQRFIREAKAASALNHPHILIIYEIGEASVVQESEDETTDGAQQYAQPIHYIAMEFIDGDTLRGKFRREKTSIREILEFFAQVADGLTKAHQAGIVHRDLKPDNVMITRDGYAKILDFGLAKLMEAPVGQSSGTDVCSEAATVELPLQLSTPGIVLGTIGYMSPEQARGQSEIIDHRSDIFSFGCMLYEAVAGRRPFVGDSDIDTLFKIVYVPPMPVTEANPSAPSELQRIIRKCLEKDADDRYQLIREVSTDLRNLRREMELKPEIQHFDAPSSQQSATSQQALTLSSNASGSQSGTGSMSPSASSPAARKSRSSKVINSLAVLPLVNVGADPNTEYLSDGITESIINNLSQLPRLRVMARATAFRYKGREVDPQEVGRELDVRAILMGRVLLRAGRLVVKVELVDVAYGSQLWGEQYNREFIDIFEIEDEIAREISAKLRLKLSQGEKKRLNKRHTKNTEAYQLYLKGRYHWNKRIEDDLKKGVEYFQRAIDKDPTYALAYAGLADSYIVLVQYSDLPFKEAHAKAKAAALRALELDDTLAEAHTSLAAVGDEEWGLIGAEKEFKRAIELNPNYPTAHQWYGEYLSRIGRHEEALAEIKRAQQLDPLSLIINATRGYLQIEARQYDQAIEQLQKTIEMDKNFFRAHSNLGNAYLEKGMFEQAIDEHERAGVLAGEDPERCAQRAATLRAAYEASGAKGYWQAQLEEDLDRVKRERVSPYIVASLYARLGERESALDWLQRAYTERDVNLLSLKIDPAFDQLRSEPQVGEMLRRIGLSE